MECRVTVAWPKIYCSPRKFTFYSYFISNFVLSILSLLSLQFFSRKALSVYCRKSGLAKSGCVCTLIMEVSMSTSVIRAFLSFTLFFSLFLLVYDIPAHVFQTISLFTLLKCNLVLQGDRMWFPSDYLFVCDPRKLVSLNVSVKKTVCLRNKDDVVEHFRTVQHTERTLTFPAFLILHKWIKE